MAHEYKRRPHWLKVKKQAGEEFHAVRRLIKTHNLHTVCKSAHCPNMGECWSRGTATFMILGENCTRNCRFCAIDHGTPQPVDTEEPRRVAEAIKTLNLNYAVITSVTRDDLPDGGAEIFAELIREVHRLVPECEVEVLIPDFQGDEAALRTVIDAKPAVLNHNLETIPRLYPEVRPQAIFERSMELLDRAKQMGAVTKTGMMLGLGEELDEIRNVMRMLRDIDCDILTLGQYMQPDKEHLPITRFVTPDEFAQLKTDGLEMGFKLVESAPLVRSSYHAEEAAKIS